MKKKGDREVNKKVGQNCNVAWIRWGIIKCPDCKSPLRFEIRTPFKMPEEANGLSWEVKNDT